ncbi:hypothetical protein QYF36_001721 [Acer negundo]|nr:hypothetical protein QYF36_001721 [Acer negundo]
MGCSVQEICANADLSTEIVASLLLLCHLDSVWIWICRLDPVISLLRHANRTWTDKTHAVSSEDIQTTAAKKKFENQINNERLKPTAKKKAKNWVDDERLDPNDIREKG